MSKDKLQNKAENPALNKADVIGCFILDQLITKWEIEADKIKAMVDDIAQPKSHRATFNHFLIQLYKCIGDAKTALKNNR